VEGIVQRQRLQQLLDLLSGVTRRALLAPMGRAAREALVSWGFPEPSLERLDVGYFPDPAYITWELIATGSGSAW
jgi:hypothetical protein